MIKRRTKSSEMKFRNQNENYNSSYKDVKSSNYFQKSSNIVPHSKNRNRLNELNNINTHNHDQLIKEIQSMNLNDDPSSDYRSELNKNTSNNSIKKPKIRNEIQEYLSKDCDNFYKNLNNIIAGQSRKRSES